MLSKIYWCEEAGTVFWLENDRVMYAPMNRDKTSDLQDGSQAEVWDECPVTEAQVRAKLA